MARVGLGAAVVPHADRSSGSVNVRTGLAAPADGLLSVFYDAEGLPWDDESDQWKILYTPADAAITRRLPPDDLHVDAEFEARRIVPILEWTVAPAESTDAREVLGTPDAIEAYEDVVGVPDDRLNTRLLGHPDPVQADMQEERQLASHGLWDGSSDSRVAALRADSGKWRLLAQIDSHEDLGMMWGDGGRLYFWIRDEDLRNRNWDAVWAILQCS